MKTKLMASALVSALVLTGSVTAPWAAEKEIKVLLNGTEISFDVNPRLENGTTLVPMRAVFEALGAQVSFNSGNSTVTAVKNGKSVSMKIGSCDATVNGEAVQLSAAPVIENGRTLVPLRIVGEAFGVDVDWDEAAYAVVMTKDDSSSSDAWKENKGEISLDSMTFQGEGIRVEGKVIKISRGGDYTVEGTANDAMIYVNTDESVKLRLNGVSLTNTTGPAIFFDNVEKGYITICKDTENFLSDGAEYENDAKGTVFSNDDLEIKGGGSLTVTGNYNHAIASDDKIKIEDGKINITAKNDGIHANDAVSIKGGEITVQATGDGIQSDGYVKIEGGELHISTDGEISESNPFDRFMNQGDWGNFGRPGGDRKRSEKKSDANQSSEAQGDGQPPEMQGGNQPPEMQGGGQPPEMQGGGQPPEMQGGGQPPEMQGDTDSSDESTSSSSKGIKAETNLIISGGEITVNSTDHSLHSAGMIFINGAASTLSSEKKKGISSHGALIIEDGEIQVLKSTEGIESKSAFCINGGTVRVNASDDGLNAGGTGGRDVRGTDEHSLYINGGDIYVNASGDGIDANSSIYINGGNIVVNGPTNNGNGALDSGDKIIQNGGTLIAVGSSGMAEYPSEEQSSAAFISYSLASSQAAETLIRIETADGKEILTYKSPKKFQSIVYSSPKLEIGQSYKIFVGGEYIGGTNTDGVLSGGDYTPSEESTEFTLSSKAALLGSSGRGGGRWGGWW